VLGQELLPSVDYWGGSSRDTHINRVAKWLFHSDELKEPN